jgi:hypothetical protein
VVFTPNDKAHLDSFVIGDTHISRANASLKIHNQSPHATVVPCPDPRAGEKHCPHWPLWGLFRASPSDPPLPHRPILDRLPAVWFRFITTSSLTGAPTREHRVHTHIGICTTGSFFFAWANSLGFELCLCMEHSVLTLKPGFLSLGAGVPHLLNSWALLVKPMCLVRGLTGRHYSQAVERPAPSPHTHWSFQMTNGCLHSLCHV